MSLAKFANPTLLSTSMFRSAVTALFLACSGVFAQELVEQPAPFTAWLDFNVLGRANAPQPSLPIWFESFQSDTHPATATSPSRTIFRLRMRRMPALHRDVMLRVYFDDLPDMQPLITAWTETGRERFRSEVLGTGIGLPTQATLLIPVEDTDYVEIEVPGDGTNVRGAFISSVKAAEIKQAFDFNPLPLINDPFGKQPEVRPTQDDTRIFGRVKATVDDQIARLDHNGDEAVEWTFELASQPLAAIVSFEVLNADFTAPPMVSVNGGKPVPANVQWPDLSDPGFRGESRALEPGMRFQYTGWLRAQIAVPGFQMTGGLNKVTVTLSDESGSIAVRNVELQLKQNWKHFDYILTPVKQ
jgi:hypothetical protein